MSRGESTQQKAQGSNDLSPCGSCPKVSKEDPHRCWAGPKLLCRRFLLLRKTRGKSLPENNMEGLLLFLTLHVNITLQHYLFSCLLAWLCFSVNPVSASRSYPRPCQFVLLGNDDWLSQVGSSKPRLTGNKFFRHFCHFSP